MNFFNQCHNASRRFIPIILASFVFCFLLDSSSFLYASANPNDGFPLLMKVMRGSPLPKTSFTAKDPRFDQFVDLFDYGQAYNAGTADYHFDITRLDDLKTDIGAGIYPNEEGVRVDPRFIRMNRSGKLRPTEWDLLENRDQLRAFFRWTISKEDPGVRLFFTARILEKSGHVMAAAKAYYTALVLFPKSYCWSQDHTFVWYIAPAALSGLQNLCATYPDLGLEIQGARADVLNINDTDQSNDIVVVDPGRLVRRSLKEKIETLPALSDADIVEQRGSGQVQVVKFRNGHWQLRVNGQPFFVRGVHYAPTDIGLGPHSNPAFLSRWMFRDQDGNGWIDAAYDTWVDVNNNLQQDRNEPAVGDFQLMQDMGINAIRFMPDYNYFGVYDPELINKPLLRHLFERYGIRLVVCDFFGAYTRGTGATWQEGTDYRNPEQRQRILDNVRRMVEDLKDEPFVLMWILGNENNMSADYSGINATRTNASLYPQEYAGLLNEAAQMIHEIDGNHPVGVGNIELGLLEVYRTHAPELDFLGINSYRGKDGFGSLWKDARAVFDRPVLITEYGCDAYFDGRGEDEEGQAGYHAGNARDIALNQAGGPGKGNAIGGVAFEFLDEWWKDTNGDSESTHQTRSQFPFPFPDGQSHEEWLGLVGQNPNNQNPPGRNLRQAYRFYKSFWGSGESLNR